MCAPTTLGITSQNFIRDVARGRGDNVDANFGRAAPNKTWDGKKRPKIQCDFWQLSTLSLSTTNSGTDRRNKNLKSTLTTTFHPLLSKNLVKKKQKVIGAHVDPHKWTFSGEHIFLHALQPP